MVDEKEKKIGEALNFALSKSDVMPAGDNLAESSKSEFTSKKKKFFAFALPFIYLIGIIFVGVWIRVLQVNVLDGNRLFGYDPYLFLRYSTEIVETGKLVAHDFMRYFPLGHDTFLESRFFPYVLAYLHKFLILINPEITITQSLIVYPVIFFTLSILVFFFLIKKISNWKIALLSSAFLVVIPTFFYRTVAGFADKEPLGIFLFLVSFYFAVCMFKAKTFRQEMTFAVLTGLFTGILGLVWGVVDFSLMIISSTFFVLFFLGKSKRKDFFVYSLWFVITFLILVLFSQKYDQTLLTLFFGNQGIFIPTFIFAIMLLHLLFANKLSKIKFNSKSKFNLSSEVKSFFTVLIIGIFASIFIFGTNFLGEMFQRIYGGLLHPLGTDKVTLSIQENFQPYFSLWTSEFSFAFLLLFLFGSIFLLNKIVEPLNKKYRKNLVLSYALLLLGFLFSRFSSNSILNGENFISQLVYFGPMIIFAIYLCFTYFKTRNLEGEQQFKLNTTTQGLIFSIIWFIWLFIGARGAARLFFLFSPITCFMAAFLIITGFELLFRIRKKQWKILPLILLFFFLTTTVYSFIFNYVDMDESISESFNSQWKDATDWISTSTPEDAIIASWWDYGYWIQSEGERATILDGGNRFPYWNHLFARQVLTADNEQDALEWLYSHDATHLLIASSDISKSFAISEIGSNENLDRVGGFGRFFIRKTDADENTGNLQHVYSGGIAVDQNFIINDNVFPAGSAIIKNIIINTGRNNEILPNSNPYLIIEDNGRKANIPIKYLYSKGKLFEFNEGIDGVIYLLPHIFTSAESSEKQVIDIGVALYFSPKVRSSLLTKFYFLDSSTYFELVYEGSDTLINFLNGNEDSAFNNEIFLNGEFKGPIKIWKINYPAGMELNKSFLEIE